MYLPCYLSMLSEKDRSSLQRLMEFSGEPQPKMIESVLQHEALKKRAVEIESMSDAEVRALPVPDDEDGISFGELYDILVNDGMVDSSEISIRQFYIEHT